MLEVNFPSVQLGLLSGLVPWLTVGYELDEGAPRCDLMDWDAQDNAGVTSGLKCLGTE